MTRIVASADGASGLSIELARRQTCLSQHVGLVRAAQHDGRLLQQLGRFTLASTTFEST